MVQPFQNVVGQNIKRREDAKIAQANQALQAQQFASKKQDQDIEIAGRLAMGIRDASPENKQQAYQEALATAQKYNVSLQGMPTEYTTQVDGQLQQLINASGVETKPEVKGEFGYAMKIIESPEFANLSPEDQKRYKDFADTKAKGLDTVFGQAQAGAAGKGVAELAYKPKLAAEETTARESAKFRAGSVEELSNMESKLPELEQAVLDLKKLGAKASYTKIDRAKDAIAREAKRTTPGMIARTEYMTMIDNMVLPLLRDTFGAAFTEKEGATLKATLGDPNKSPKERDAALNAFIKQKQRDIISKKRKLGMKEEKPVENSKDYSGTSTEELLKGWD